MRSDRQWFLTSCSSCLAYSNWKTIFLLTSAIYLGYHFSVKQIPFFKIAFSTLLYVFIFSLFSPTCKRWIDGQIDRSTAHIIPFPIPEDLAAVPRSPRTKKETFNTGFRMIFSSASISARIAHEHWEIACHASQPHPISCQGKCIGLSLFNLFARYR